MRIGGVEIMWSQCSLLLLLEGSRCREVVLSQIDIGRCGQQYQPALPISLLLAARNCDALFSFYSKAEILKPAPNFSARGYDGT